MVETSRRKAGTGPDRDEQVRGNRLSELRLMAVHAHPDDESSKGAATMARYADEGARVLVVTLTGGERGDILNPAMDLPDVHGRMAEIRRHRCPTAASAWCRSRSPSRSSCAWSASSSHT